MNDPTFDKMMDDDATCLQLQRAYSAYRFACGAESLTPYNMHAWFISGSPLGPESATTPAPPTSPDAASARGERRAASRRAPAPTYTTADFHAICQRLADAKCVRYVLRDSEGQLVCTNFPYLTDVVLYDCDAE